LLLLLLQRLVHLRLLLLLLTLNHKSLHKLLQQLLH
jgi:hypothetical protein